MPRVLELIVQPNESVSHFSYSVTLENARYSFAFYTNTVDGGWFMDLANEDESSIARGVGLSNGVNILFPYRHLEFPPGVLYVKDKGLDGADPDLAAFSEGRAALYYLESE